MHASIFACCWIWQRRAYSRWSEVWNFLVLKLVLATKSMSFHKKKVTLSFWLYGLFTSSIQLCFVSFRGPLPYPNWLSSRWSMPCQRHGKRVGWHLSHCWATAYPGELWVVLLAKSHSEKFLSLLSIRQLPCFYDAMRAMRDGDNFFPSVHGIPRCRIGDQ